MHTHRLTQTAAVQWLTRIAYPYGAVSTIRRGPLKGQRIVVSPSMGATYIWGAQNWSWTREIQPGWTVYDIGANCGQSTLHLARAVGANGKVVAFEPVPENFKALARNVELNGLANVTPVCAAASDRDGVDHFSFDRAHSTSGHLSPLGNIEVRLVRLDDGPWPAPHLIKLDVEGAAPQVLAGAQGLIAKRRPVIFMEMHSTEELQAAAEVMRVHGYTATHHGRPVLDPVAEKVEPLILRPPA